MILVTESTVLGTRGMDYLSRIYQKCLLYNCTTEPSEITFHYTFPTYGRQAQLNWL